MFSVQSPSFNFGVRLAFFTIAGKSPMWPFSDGSLHCLIRRLAVEGGQAHLLSTFVDGHPLVFLQ